MILGDVAGRGKKRFSSISFQKVLPIEMESLASEVLEHDPDILVVEDVSESRFFKTAAKVAMRGKLALCGISCRDAADTLEHLLYFQQNYSILAYVKGIVSFKGVRSLCPLCKKSYFPSEEEKAVLPSDSLPAAGYFTALGCSACGYTGYKGNKYLVDVISFNNDIVEVFAAAKESGEVLQYLRDKGYRGVLEEGIELLNAGEISPEEFLVAVKH
jgi:type II secretory ATPase GspE/PulE/Tfp pilus assembly ATPase PilB-like protein